MRADRRASHVDGSTKRDIRGASEHPLRRQRLGGLPETHVAVKWLSVRSRNRANCLARFAFALKPAVTRRIRFLSFVSTLLVFARVTVGSAAR